MIKEEKWGKDWKRPRKQYTSWPHPHCWPQNLYSYPPLQIVGALRCVKDIWSSLPCALGSTNCMGKTLVAGAKMGRWRDFPCLNEPSVLDTDRRQEQSPGRREGPRGLVWPQSTAALPPASQCSESHACRLPSTRLLLLSLVPDSRSSNCTLATNNFHCLKYALGKNGHQFHLWKATNSWYKVVSPKLHEYTWAKQHEAEQVYTNRCYSVIHIILWDVLLL